MYYQLGGGNCSLCGSPGTNKTTCPLNPLATNPNYNKHPKAPAPAGHVPPKPAPARASKVNSDKVVSFMLEYIPIDDTLSAEEQARHLVVFKALANDIIDLIEKEFAVGVKVLKPRATLVNDVLALMLRYMPLDDLSPKEQEEQKLDLRTLAIETVGFVEKELGKYVPPKPAPAPPKPAPAPPKPAPAPPKPAPAPPKPAPAPSKLLGLMERESCKNDSTVLGDFVTSSENPILYITESGHCFNVETELIPSFLIGNFRNPYTGDLFEYDELENMLRLFPFKDENNISVMKNAMYKGLNKDVVEAISKYPNVFLEIYKAGYSCLIDHTDRMGYGEDRVFFYATEGLSNLLNAINTLPPEKRDIFMNLQADIPTVGRVLETANVTCIHGKGRDLLKIFMNNYHMLPNGAKPDIGNLGILQFNTLQNINARNNAYILCLNTLSGLNMYSTDLFIFNEPMNGKGSFIWRLFGYDTSKTPVTHIADSKPYDRWQLAIYNYMYELLARDKIIINQIFNVSQGLRAVPPRPAVAPPRPAAAPKAAAPPRPAAAAVPRAAMAANNWYNNIIRILISPVAITGGTTLLCAVASFVSNGLNYDYDHERDNWFVSDRRIVDHEDIEELNPVDEINVILLGRPWKGLIKGAKIKNKVDFPATNGYKIRVNDFYYDADAIPPSVCCNITLVRQ